MKELALEDNIPMTERRKPILDEKRWLLFVYVPIFVVAIMLFGAIFEDHRGISRVVDVMGTLGLNILAFAWCRIDSRERGYKLHRYFSYAVVILGTLALLYYLFRSRGFRRGLVSTGWLVLYILLCLVAALIVATVILVVLAVIGVMPSKIFES